MPTQVVEHFIDIADVHWIMDCCLCRQASQCKNYPVELGCLFLGRAVLDINPKLGRRVNRQEALAHIERCRDAKLVPTIGRNKLDTVWMGVGPGTRLFTICNCCPCCCLWGILPHSAGHIQRKLSRMPGISVSSSADCDGCGICVSTCFVHAVNLVDGQAIVSEECRGCGHCVVNCPQKAMSMTINDRSYVDKAVARLSPLVKFD